MYKLGIDLGGTNIVAGVVDEDYKILATAKRKTNLPRPAEEIVADLAAVTFEAIESAGLTPDDIDGYGIGCPGSIDNKTGAVSYSNNLGFYDLPLGELLCKKTGKKFFVENDATAAAYGEYIAGAGRGCNNFVAITLGTGVGGGIIVNGQIYSGSNGAGAEIGHMVIQIGGEACTCGRHGCFETYASATALIMQTKHAMIRYPNSLMWKLCDGDIEKTSGKTAFKAKEMGDIAAAMVVDQYIRYLAVGISNVVNIFQPDMICIGGGISREGEKLTAPLNAIVDGENYGRNIEPKTIIKTADLGNDAGIIGAAYLCNLHK